MSVFGDRFRIWSPVGFVTSLMPNIDFLMLVLDLAISFLTVAALLFLLLKGWLKSSLHVTSGRYLAVTGLSMMLLSVLINLAWPAIRSAPFALQSGQLGSEEMPVWFGWLLSRFAFVLLSIGILKAIVERRGLEVEMHSSSRQIKAAEEGFLQSEERFRRMVETTSESMYCFEFDPPLPVELPIAEQIGRSHEAVLVECNHAFAQALGVERPEDAIGRSMGSIERSSDAQAHYRIFKSFIENDYQLTDYELVYQSQQGNDCALKISLTGFGHDGCLDKIWGAEHSIQDLRQTQFALDARKRSQELLADVSSRLVKATLDQAHSAMKSCLKDVCLFLNADRTTLFWVDWEKQTADALYYWNKAGVAGPISASNKRFPHLASMAMRSDVIRIDDVSQMPASAKTDREVLASFGLKSALVVPLVVAGANVGAISIANLGKQRHWTDQDVSDLRVFAELFASFILRQKSYQALDEALACLQRATDRLEAENVYLQQEIKSTTGFAEIIGQSGALVQCLHEVEQVAATMTPVLILGETGTGKELIARAVHEHSDRNSRPLVKVNCAALPGNLIESELFGYEKGAFTGAISSKRGRFDLADKGTLFLDEIGDIPIDLQAKLLRVLQDGEFERLGSTKTVKVDVRIIVATNRILADAVHTGEFRSDLYYRINTFPITLPALRDRGKDIQLLAEHFVRAHSQRLARKVKAISAIMLEQLLAYSWPGNVRELEGVIQRSLISGSGPVLDLAETLIVRPDSKIEEPRIISSNIADLRIVEREHILTILEEASWKISGESGAAAMLGVPPSTLRSKMKKLSIVRPH